MEEKSSICQEYLKINEKNQWISVYQVISYVYSTNWKGFNSILAFTPTFFT